MLEKSRPLLGVGFWFPKELYSLGSDRILSSERRVLGSERRAWLHAVMEHSTVSVIRIMDVVQSPQFYFGDTEVGV